MPSGPDYHRAYYQHHRERITLQRRKRLLERYMTNGPAELVAIERRLADLQRFGHLSQDAARPQAEDPAP